MKRDGRSVRVPVSGQVGEDLEIQYATEVVQSGRWAYGEYNEKFAKALAEYIGVRHAVLCNSGSSADLLAVSSLTSPDLGERRLRKGDKVITAALSFPTTVNAIVQNGLIPVFVDSSLYTFNIRTDRMMEAIHNDPKIKAAIITHTLGNPVYMKDWIDEVKDKIWLIEDNCDSLGGIIHGRRTGSFGHMSTLSFYPAHHITTGEGGAVLTGNSKLNKILDSYNSWGKDCWCDPGFDNTCGKRFGWQLGDLPYGYDHKYTFSHIGYNLKMTNIQAAIGYAQMSRIDRFVEKRRENRLKLFGGLCELSKFTEYFRPQMTTSDSESSWFGFGMFVIDNKEFTRNDIIQHLEDNGIATRLLFAGNITRQPAYKDVEYEIHGGLEHADYLAENAFWIGCFPKIGDEEIEHIKDTFKSFLERLG